MSRAEPKLTTGDAIFLSFLTWGPMSAYDIKKIMAVSVNHFWDAAHSQVYQQAARLARDGFVREKEAPGGRRNKVLTLTAKGTHAVKDWLGSPAAPAALRDEGLAKLFFAAHGDLGKIAAMLRERRAHHEMQLKEYEEIREHLERAPGSDPPFQLDTLKLGLRITHAYIDWCDETLARLEKNYGKT
jgi:DNA-binding PadR family transcriptional regulator